MKERIKGAFTKKKIFHFLKMALFVVALSPVSYTHLSAEQIRPWKPFCRAGLVPALLMNPSVSNRGVRLQINNRQKT